jgi:hypothetical protein
MRRRLCLVIWGLMLGAIVPLSARTYSFPEQNFRCEIPDSWTMIKATGASVMAQSPTGRESFKLMTSLLTEGLTLDSSRFQQSIRDMFTRNGFEVVGPTYVLLQGQRFSYWKLEPPDPNPFGTRSAWAWAIIADGRLYVLQPSCDANPNSDPELMGMVNSFQFISSPRIPVAGEGQDPAGSSLGNEGSRAFSPWFLIGMVFYLAVVPAVAIGILIIFIKRQERKRTLLLTAKPPVS